MHAFDILGDPVRRRILELLADGERPAGEVGAVVEEEFGISQPGVSRHLRVLRENGFATVRAEGTRRVYAVNAEPLREVDEWLGRYRRFWDQRLDALGTELARGKRARRRTPTTSTQARTTGRRHDKEGVMFDIASIITDHQRALSRRGTAEGEAYVLRLGRHYDAPVEDVWDACTDPERIGRWFLPITGDLRPGGNYQLEGNAGGRIEACEPPRRLAVTWELYGGTSDLVLTLSPGADGGTDFELEHAAVLPFTEEEYIAGIGGMAPGWEDALAGLGMHLSGDLPETSATRWYPPGSEEVERRWGALGQVWRDLARAMFSKT